MLKAIEVSPGVTLRCFSDQRFKQEGLSLLFVRPMCRQEAALNALLPAVLLRGSEDHPDLRAITLRLDDLYGASMGAQVRRVGDYQTMGLYCAFLEDRYALPGDQRLFDREDQYYRWTPGVQSGSGRIDLGDPPHFQLTARSHHF